MKGQLLLGITTIALLFAVGLSPAADLDFGQAVIHVPDTHDSAPYRWQARKNPSDYQAEITSVPAQGAYLLTVSPPPAQNGTGIELFFTDKYLKSFIHPTLKRQDDGVFLFRAALLEGETYQAEIIFQDTSGWVNLGRRFKATMPGALAVGEGEDAGQAGYEVRIKQFPEIVYATHAVTFVFEVLQDGKPVDGLEPVDDAMVRVAAWRQGSWFRPAGDFVYADSQGNENEREAAVSLVFNEPGPHRVFAEYRHRGLTRWVSREIPNVWLEPAPQ
jgi:hypothetical protein